MLNYLTITEA